VAIATLSPPADVRRHLAVVTSVAPAVVAALVVAALGCGGAGRELGEACGTSGECRDGLQCLQQVCVPRCEGHVDCGDGSVCTAEGECRSVVSAVDDPCTSELECGAGQTCRLSQQLGTTPGTCQVEAAAALEGERCTVDIDCRMGGCALGRCVSLCRETDCRRGWTCAAIPLPQRSTSVNACLPASATIEFEVLVPPPDPATPGLLPELPVPVPSTARSLVLVFEAPTPTQSVGAGVLLDPTDQVIYREPVFIESYFTNPVRHAPRPGISVLQVPSASDDDEEAPGTYLRPGIYTVTVRSFREAPGQPVNGRPRLRVIEKLGSGTRLDLHFYFLDLADHPCQDAIGTALNATTAQMLTGFQDEFLGAIEDIFRPANITLGDVTYDDVASLVPGGRPELAVLDVSQASALFALPIRRGGVSIFFVRGMEPDGQQILTNSTPGAPIPGTGASAIAVSVDTLCYRSWAQLARQTAHGVARHMALFRNVEPDALPGHVDPIDDTDDGIDNLMHWSEHGGSALSIDQREILRASPVLR
jgi:hypothetical protein